MGPRYLPRGGPAIVFGLTIVAAGGAIAYSHVSQVEERKVMRAGVERDKERLRQKRRLLKEEEKQQQ